MRTTRRNPAGSDGGAGDVATVGDILDAAGPHRKRHGRAAALLAVVALLGCRDGAVVGDDDAPSAAAECVVRATVVRSEDGAPLAGARVRLVSGRAVVAGPTATGDDGRVEFTHVAPTQYLMAIAEADGRGTVDEIASTLFGCSQGTTVVPERDVVIRLPEAGPVTGRVLAPDGTPMDGAEIEIHRTSDVRPPRGTSGSDGRFRIEGVPLGQSPRCARRSARRAPRRCASARSSTRRSAARCRSTSSSPASRSPTTRSSWATGWTSPRSTGTCPSWGRCGRRRSRSQDEV